jgi:hypothetical protein
MKGSHYSISSLPVREILAGVYRNGNRNYYRITADGRCEVFPVRKLLMALGMGSTSASHILEQACIPAGTFVCNPVVKYKEIAIIKADVEAYPLDEETALDELDSDEDMEIELEDELEADELEESSPSEDLEPFRDRVQPLNTVASSNKSKKEVARAQRAAKAAEAHAKKFELVRQGKYHGIYNKDSASTELFRTEGEALEFLRLLLHGYEGFYHSVPSQNELEPIDYND